MIRPPLEPRAKAMMPRSISLGSRTPIGVNSTWNEGATVWQIHRLRPARWHRERPRPALRQPRNVHSDPSCLVLCQDLGLPSLGIVVSAVEVRQRLPVGVADDVAAGHRGGVPGRGKSAGRFGHLGRQPCEYVEHPTRESRFLKTGVSRACKATRIQYPRFRENWGHPRS
jgi:hypothetical protein